MIVLGIDPGTQKAGFAVVAGGPPAATLTQGIEPLSNLSERVKNLVERFSIQAIALGKGTNARAVAQILEGSGLRVHFVDERDTTFLARALYFTENPPRGWRRWLPLGMQLPPRPIDDYAAVLIAQRFLGA